MAFFQVWLEMSHLDYCNANFLHVVDFCLISFHYLRSFIWTCYYANSKYAPQIIFYLCFLR